MKQQKLRGVITAAVIAAAYAALSLALAPLSFGQIQIRAAEAFTLLPIYSPYAVWGVTLGCAITNAAGVATGANFLGIIDVFAGTAASLVSAPASRPKDIADNTPALADPAATNAPLVLDMDNIPDPSTIEAGDVW